MEKSEINSPECQFNICMLYSISETPSFYYCGIGCLLLKGLVYFALNFTLLKFNLDDTLVLTCVSTYLKGKTAEGCKAVLAV